MGYLAKGKDFTAAELSIIDNLEPVGSALQQIRVNSAGTALEYFTSAAEGTVTSVSVVTANGVSGSVATATTTPAITLTLGAITPSAVQISGLTASEIVITDASKNLASAAVATYPSLTELSYVKGVTSAIQTQITGKAATNQTMYIGTTAVTIDRASAALSLAGITLTTPDIGTPSAGTLTNCTGLPVNGIVDDTTSALGVGTLELGHATDTTLSRSAAGILAVEGVVIPSISSTDTLSNKTLTASKLVSGGFIADANGNELLIGVTTASAVNEVTLTNAATAGAPKLAATGGDTNINLDLDSKGTGIIRPQHAVVNKVVALTDGVNIATDASLGNIFTVTLAGNRTMDNPTNLTDGQTIIYKIKQDATGGRTLALGTVFRGSTDLALPALSTAANAVDYLMFYYNSGVTKLDILAVNKGFAS